MDNLLGIENIKSVLGVAAKIGNSVGKALEDNKINSADLIIAPDLIFGLVPLFSVQYSQIVPEAKDLTPEESSELVEYYREVFQIPQDNIELIIEDVLALVNETVSLILKFVKIFKK